MSSPNTGELPRRRSWLGRLMKLLAVLVVGITVAACLALLLVANGMLTDRIAALASEKLGRKVTLGDVRVGLGLPLKVRVRDIAVGNPAGMDGDLLKAEAADARVLLGWSPLFNFDPDLEDIEIRGAKADIRFDETGKSNLGLGDGASGKTGVLALPRTARIRNSRLSIMRAGAAEPVTFESLEADAAIDRTSGKTSSKGKMTYNGAALDFEAEFADLGIATTGLPTALRLALKGPAVDAAFSGDVVLTGEPQLSGAAKVETASLGDLAGWISGKAAEKGKGAALPASLDGKVKLKGKELGLDGAAFKAGSAEGRLTGALSFAGEQAKYTGAIATTVLDLSAFSRSAAGGARSLGAEGDAAEEELPFEIEPDTEAVTRQLRAIQAGEPVEPAAPRAQPSLSEGGEEEAPAAGDEGADTRSLKAGARKAAWSVETIDFSALGALGLDATLTAERVAYGTLDIRNARIKARLDKGKLDAMIEDADIAGGKARGSIAIDSVAPMPAASLLLDLIGVAAEPVVTEFTGKPFLSGTSNALIDVKAQGKSVDALAKSLEGKAKFKMVRGALRGIDVKKATSSFCLSELMKGAFVGSKKAFKIDMTQKTGFENLDAEYAIRKGVLKSTPDLEIGGSEVEIRSRGEVSVAERLLQQNLRFKVVPPPKWPAVPVHIAGSWEKPALKLDTAAVDWIAVLNAAVFGCEAPTRSLAAEAGPAEEEVPLPVSVREAIEGVLSANVDASVLSEDGKTALRALLGGAADQGASAAPGDAGQPAP